jgi:hypothetical protein
VGLAYAFAGVSERVTVLIYGSQEFMDLSRRFEVVTVPKIWINDRIYIDGAAPTREMMARTLVLMIEQALDTSIPPGRFLIWED